MSKMTNLDVENFLGDFKSRSEIEILEEGSKEKNDLLESARKRGIIISKNDRDLGVIKTIYCFTSKANANGARLPKDEFIKIFPQIVGRPMDYGHDRELILGFYVDYRFVLKEEKAIAYAIFFRGNYPKLWEKAKKFQKKKRLSSSFEIWSPKDKREKLSDGTYKLHNLAIAGGALIFEEFGEEPAFKDAKVLQMAKKVNLNECVSEECLVCASKYKGEDLIVADKDYFTETIKENVKKLQDEKKVKEQPKKIEPKKEVKVEEKKEEPKAEPKPEEKKEEPKIVETGKIKCSNCSESIDYNGIDVRIKCPKCFAILNKEGVMQYPPQIKDFQVLCPSCKIGNWLILSKDNKEAKVKCESCAKEYKIDFVQSNINTQELLDKFNFVYTGSASCPQCHKQIAISGVSSLKNRTIKCPKCKVEFAFNITHETYKKISKIEEIKIDKIEKSAKTEKGGKVMDYKLELSRFHRYVDNLEEFERYIAKDYDESKDGSVLPETAVIEQSARLTTEQRNALPDSDFAVVVRVKNKRTGEMRKIRMFPIHDKAHVRNALARLGQPAPQATLRKLGVSIETVKAKILRKARQLKMTQLLERYKKAKVEPKKANVKKVEKVDKKVEPKKKIEAKKEPEKKVEVKVEKAKDTISDAQKHTLALYALEDKIAKYALGIRKLVSKVRSTNKKLETVKAEKEDKIKFYKENAKKIHDRKVELADFAKDLSDEDIVNEDKFEKAQLKKQVAESKTIETASENVGDKTTKADEYTEYRKQINASAFPEVKGIKNK